MDLAFLWAIDIDFVIMWVSKLTFFVRMENFLCLMWKSIDLISVWMVEIDFVFVGGQKKHLVLVLSSNLPSFL